MSLPIQPGVQPLQLTRVDAPTRASRPGTVGGVGGASQTEGPREVAGSAFAEQLSELMHTVDATQKQAAVATTNFNEGRSDDIHGTMLALGRANITFRLAASVRNRVLDAYREVMRMGG